MHYCVWTITLAFACAACTSATGGGSSDSTSSEDSVGTSTSGMGDSAATERPPDDDGTGISTDSTATSGVTTSSGEDESSDEDEGSGAEPDVWPEPVVDEACDVAAPFETVEPVPGLEGHDARFSPDETVALFVRQKDDGGFTVWQAERRSVELPFEPARRLDALGSDSDERGPTTTSDGLTIYFFSSRPNRGGSAILRSRRQSVSEPFPAPTEVLSFLGGNVDAPYVGMDPDRIYFVGAGGGASRIYETWPDGDRLADPISVDATSSNVLLDDPVVTADGSIMYVRYFEPERSLHLIAMMQRDRLDEPFDEPMVVESLDVGESATPTWVSADQCRLYFMRADRHEEILVARRTIGR